VNVALRSGLYSVQDSLSPSLCAIFLCFFFPFWSSRQSTSVGCCGICGTVNVNPDPPAAPCSFLLLPFHVVCALLYGTGYRLPLTGPACIFRYKFCPSFRPPTNRGLSAIEEWALFDLWAHTVGNLTSLLQISLPRNY
jgi:hypothetical protein